MSTRFSSNLMGSAMLPVSLGTACPAMGYRHNLTEVLDI
jgi:hypothetical protein